MLLLDLWTATFGCRISEPAKPMLVLHHEGPVHADHVGEVEMPEILLDDGSHPHGVLCDTEHHGIAHAEGSRLIAHAAGSTVVHCEWEEQRVSFELQVQLATELAFVEAPEKVRVGYAADLRLEARQGDERIPLGEVRWETSNNRIAEIAEGRVLGRQVGEAFVTARARGATATLQIHVVP